LALSGARSYAVAIMTRSRTLSVLLAALVGPASLVGCLTPQRGEGQLVALQTGLDREFPDRGAPGDVESASVPSPASPPSPPGRPVAAPPGPPAASRVTMDAPASPPFAVSAAPSPAEESEVAARPVIRIVGSGKARTTGRKADDRIDMTLPAEHAAAVDPAAAHAGGDEGDAATAKKEAEHALALYAARDFDGALDALGAFLVRWPDHASAEAATFARGECYVAKGELVQAAEEYEAVLARYPHGSKAADALLRLGVAQQRLGNGEKAHAAFERLTREFPASDAAHHIPRSSP
jgi:tol-pal system protein YbgF